MHCRLMGADRTAKYRETTWKAAVRVNEPFVAPATISHAIPNGSELWVERFCGRHALQKIQVHVLSTLDRNQPGWRRLQPAWTPPQCQGTVVDVVRSLVAAVVAPLAVPRRPAVPIGCSPYIHDAATRHLHATPDRHVPVALC